ncbi:MAG: type II toxin-antitoxin system RelE/ParE family toxin [Pseudomonadota bacterium]
MKYRFSLLAEADLQVIYSEGIRLFGPYQASLYLTGLEQAVEFVAQFPQTNRARETSEGPIRVHRFNAHIIIYQISGNKEVLILRIRHGREDWQGD